MKKMLVLLAVVIAIAVPAMAASVAVDYTNPFFENGQLAAASWCRPWLSSGGSITSTPYISNTNNTFGAIYEKKTYGSFDVCDGEYFSGKWFAVAAGTEFTVSSDWAATLPNKSGEFRAIVYTRNNTSGLDYNHFANRFNTTNASAYQVTNLGTAGASNFVGSFTSGPLISQGYVFIAMKGFSLSQGSNEYKGQWSSRLYNTYINTPDPAPVPEPSSVIALGTGLMGLAGFVVRRRK